MRTACFGKKCRGCRLATTYEFLLESEKLPIQGHSEWDGDRDLGLSGDRVWAGPIWDSFCAVALSEPSGIGCSNHCCRKSVRCESKTLRKATALFRLLSDTLDSFGLLVGRLGKILSRDETEDSYRLVATGISLLLASNFARKGGTEESVD